MKKYSLLVVLTLGLVILQNYVFGQLTSKYVEKTFESTSLINCQTIEQPPQKGFEFNLQHRFGRVDLNDEPLHKFFGLDLVSNIRFGFIFPVFEWWSLGAGRTKYGKNYDLDTKFSLFRQTKDNATPVSVSVYFNTAFMTDDFPKILDDSFFDDGTTPFEYKFRHRVNYNAQIMVARKMNRWFSLQIAPTYIHRNLVTPEEENESYALPVGARFKVSFMSSILVEYSPTMVKSGEINANPLAGPAICPFALAFEVRPVGHVFQIIISNSDRILGQNLYTMDPVSPWDGYFFIGFNLHRNLYYRKRN